MQEITMSATTMLNTGVGFLMQAFAQKAEPVQVLGMGLSMAHKSPTWGPKLGVWETCLDKRGNEVGFRRINGRVPAWVKAQIQGEWN
jgi:hypothetical protein